MSREESATRRDRGPGGPWSAPSLRDCLLGDLRVYAPHDARPRGVLRRMIFDPGYAGLALWRIAQRIHGGPGLARGRLRGIVAALLNRFVLAAFSIEIHLAARIGWGCRLAHGHEIVIGEGVCLGESVTVYNSVTFGARAMDGEEPAGAAGVRYPEVGDRVRVYVGARIIGPVRIGAGAVIGANAVVLSDVPAGAVAVGVPARARPGGAAEAGAAGAGEDGATD